MKKEDYYQKELLTEIKIKQKKNKQKGRFPPMFLRTLAASILGNTLAGKGVINADEGVREQVKVFNVASFFN